MNTPLFPELGHPIYEGNEHIGRLGFFYAAMGPQEWSVQIHDHDDSVLVDIAVVGVEQTPNGPRLVRLNKAPVDGGGLGGRPSIVIKNHE